MYIIWANIEADISSRHNTKRQKYRFNTSLYMRMNLNIILITTFNCQRVFQVCFIMTGKRKILVCSNKSPGVMQGGGGATSPGEKKFPVF